MYIEQKEVHIICMHEGEKKISCGKKISFQLKSVVLIPSLQLYAIHDSTHFILFYFSFFFFFEITYLN